MIDDRVIARIAELFYIHNISQYEIADKFNFSKAKVCRLIKEAKKRKIIEFQIKNVDKRPIELEQKFEKKFKLKEAIIFYNSDINTCDEEVIFQEIGKIGTDYIHRIIDNNLNFALTWGKTLYYVIKNLKVDKKYNVNVFSTIGSVSLTETAYQNVNLAQMLSERIGGTCYPIYLPLILETPELKESLTQENVINKVIGDTSKIDYYFTSLGTISKNSRMYTLGGFDLNFFNALISKKIVGEIGLNFYDINGNFIKAGLEDRTINLSVDEIQKIKNKIVIAFGDEKVDAISGFLKTKIADVLITDSKTAEKVLEKAEET
jgi:DNA-binding transcriptional regulator LsrR (DeoR family)